MSAEPGRKKPYSSNIGWRVVYQRLGMERSFAEIAKSMQIAISTAHRIYKKFEETGEVGQGAKPLQAASTRSKLDDQHKLFIIALVAVNPTMYLKEICTAIHDVTGLVVSPSAVCKTLHGMGYSRKKVTQIALQRSMHFRAAFRAQVADYRPEYFVWVDETGCDRRNYVRKFGYSLRGMSPICYQLLKRGQRLSAIAAISSDGLVGVEITEGTVDGSKFVDFIHGILIPEMEPFDGTAKRSIVIMDNCSIHHTADVAQALEDAGILVMYLPPYSPDLNPIEECFSYIKYFLMAHDDVLQVSNNPKSILLSAFDNITAAQCKGWISHAGYN